MRLPYLTVAQPQVYKMQPLVKWRKANLDNYIIMEESAFKEVLAHLVATNPLRPMALPGGEWVRFSGKVMCMGAAVHTVVRGVYDYDNLLTGVEGDERYLAPEDLPRMPAIDTPMWEEAYASGSADFFNMEPVDGKLGHVVNGVYVAPTADSFALTYAEAKVRMAPAPKAKKGRKRALR